MMTHRLLLVEDNPGDADLASARLADTPASIFDVRYAKNLAEAMTFLRDSLVDAVILDLNLPDSLGLDTLARIRTVTGKAAIIVVSGVVTDHLRSQAIDQGAQAVLGKDEAFTRLFGLSILHLIQLHQAREHRRQIEQLLEANPDALIVVSEVGKVLYVNQAGLLLYGRNRDDFIGELIDFSLGDDKPLDILVVRPDGNRSCEVRIASIDWQGAPALLGSIRDLTELRQSQNDAIKQKNVAEARAEQLQIEISERMRAESALRLEQEAIRTLEERMRFALQYGGVGIWDMDCTTGVVQWSEIAEAQFGVQRGTFGGTFEAFIERVHPDDRASVLEAVENAAKWATEFSVQHRTILHDGTTRWLIGTGRFHSDDQGKPVRAIGISLDVTARRAIEAQLRQAQKMEAIGNLTGGMAHDFNNMLAVIIGNLDLLRSQLPPDGEALELASDSLEAALRGAELTRRLLAFARLQPLAPQRVAINDLISDLVKLLRRVLGEQIEITINLANSVWPAVVDPMQLESAITNLATNARDAMPDGGSLTIATAKGRLDEDFVALHPGVAVGDYAVVEMSDTGTGMTPEVMAKIFEPFYTTKELGKGTGLGLSMVFGFMKQSGGHINVYSEPGIGTTFRLYLPRSLDDLDEAEPSQEMVVPRAGGESILVVEDNAQLRRVAVRQLGALGYRVIEAGDASAALTALESERVDLLFTDIVMPGGISGLTLAGTAKERWPAVKVILTSGFPETNLTGRFGAPAHGVPIMSKPYRGDELACAIRKALDS